MTVLEQVRKAIFEVFGSYISKDPERAMEIIKHDTYIGSEDPGEWAPDAPVTIHCEGGIPSGDWDPYLLEDWFRVTEKLDGHFCEHVNSAVIAVWPID